MTAISEARWLEAQRCEAEYWAQEAKNPKKLHRDIAEGHHFTRGVLDIRWETAHGLGVLDIAGGPHPLGVDVDGPVLDLESYTVLDPGDYPEEADMERIRMRAEDFKISQYYDEVWGYNVLQHVVDPTRVMAVARTARFTIRWFDVVDTPIYPVHPHSIKADWLRGELSRDGFRIVRDIDGSRLVEGHRQKWVALVAGRV